MHNINSNSISITLVFIRCEVLQKQFFVAYSLVTKYYEQYPFLFEQNFINTYIFANAS